MLYRHLIRLFLFTICFTILTSATTQYACPPCNSRCDELTFSEAGDCPHCGMELVLAETIAPREAKLAIAFYLQPGVEVLDFAGPMEVFSYAGFKVFTVSKTKEPILSQGILTIVPDYDLTDAPPADILAFFGGNGLNTSQDEAVIDWVREQSPQYHFSVCTGALILAEAGVLDGQQSTTFHSTLDYLAEQYPATTVLRDVRYVDNGTVITTAGISAGIDGALHLVAKLKGFNAARKVAYHMEYDKWTPQDGFIRTDDDPYRDLPTPEALLNYTGTYAYGAEVETVEVFLSTRERGLSVRIGAASYPLFWEGENHFTNVQDQAIHFVRNEAGQVTGYRVGEDATIYPKH